MREVPFEKEQSFHFPIRQRLPPAVFPPLLRRDVLGPLPPLPLGPPHRLLNEEVRGRPTLGDSRQVLPAAAGRIRVR